MDSRPGLGPWDHLQHVPSPSGLHDPRGRLDPHHHLPPCCPCSLKISFASKGGGDINPSSEEPIQPRSGRQTGKGTTQLGIQGESGSGRETTMHRERVNI